MRSLLPVFFLLLYSSAWAQEPVSIQSGYELRYKLSINEASHLLKKGFYEYSDYAFQERQPYDTVWANKEINEVPLGHYLLIGTNEQRLVMRLQLVQEYALHQIDRKHMLEFAIERQGSMTSDVRVKLNRRRVRYNQQTQSYRVKQPGKRALVIVEGPGSTALFYLNDDYSWQSGFERAGKKIIHFAPIQVLWKPWYDGVRSIVNGYATGYIAGIARLFDGYGSEQRIRRRARGYLVLNQPKYKPGDTIRYKAKLLTRKGRPYDRNISFQLGTYYGSGTKHDLPVAVKRGEFYGELVLHDSLNLAIDRSYQLKVIRRGAAVMTKDFRLEDYQLKSEQYSAALHQYTHNAFSENKLILTGKDENENSLRNVRYELTVEATRVYGLEDAGNLVVPIELFSQKGTLKPDGPTEVVLPDSIFPRVNMEYMARVAFINAANDRVERTDRSNYQPYANALKMTLVNDSLVFSYPTKYPGSRSVAIRAMFTSRPDSVIVKGQTPLKVKFNPAFSAYAAFSPEGQLMQRLNTGVLSADIGNDYSRTKDSIRISLQNPRQLPIWYLLHKNSRTVKRGFTTQGLEIKEPVGTSGTYSLEYRYLWLGAMKKAKIELPYFEKQLILQVQQSDLIIPGATDSITVKVTDHKGKPRQGVDVLAMALTGKFSNSYVPEVPYFGKSRTYYLSRSPHDQNSRLTSKLPNLPYQNWRGPLQLDSSYFYQITRTDKVLTTTRSSPDSTTQFSVLPLKNSLLQKVGYIKLDGELVFLHLGNPFQRFVFGAEPGWHKLEVRTSKALLTVDSVYFAPNKKTLVSIPFDRSSEKLTIEPITTRYLTDYTDEEIQMLLNHTLSLQLSTKGMYKVIQGDRVFLGNHHYGADEVGPLKPGKVTLELSEQKSIIFDFDPGHIYEVINDQVYKKRISTRAFYLGEVKFSDVFGYLSDTPSTPSQTSPTLSNVSLNNPNMQAHEGLVSLTWPPESRLEVKRVLVRSLDNQSILEKLGKPETMVLDSGRYEVIVTGQTGYLVDSLVLKARHYILYRIDTSAFSGARPDYLDSLENIVYPPSQLVTAQTITVPKPKPSGKGYVFGTVTGGDDGLGIPRANVTIKGTTLGTPTDLDGNYSLNVPAGGAVLVFSFIGYITQEIYVGHGQEMSVILQLDMLDLDEVVVVGYGTTNSSEIYGDVAPTLQGKVSGLSIAQPGAGDDFSIRLRGNSTFGKMSPLVVVDGVVNGDLSGIDPADITDISTLQGSTASALYGSSAANGVILVTTVGGNKKQQINNPFDVPLESSANSLRNNFRDYAYWQPSLKTDKNGEVTFVAQYPDDVTSWKSHFLAMSNNGYTGQLSSTVKAYKPVVSRLTVPRFAIEGDSLTSYAQTVNYTSDSLTVNREFSINGQEQNLGDIWVNKGRVDSVGFGVTTTDSVEMVYQFQSKLMSDGELRKIPVYRRGLLQQQGQFHVLSGDTIVTARPNEKLGLPKVTIVSDLRGLMLNTLKALQEYSYWCNEQTASKLIALLAEEEMTADSAGTGRQAREVKKYIQRLMKARNDDGGWGWWQGMKTSHWVTNHVTRALLYAQLQGYTVKADLVQATEALVQDLPMLHKHDLLESLETLVMVDSTYNVTEYLDLNQKQMEGNMGITDRLRFIRLKQYSGYVVDADSIARQLKPSLFGGQLMPDTLNNHHNNDVAATLVAYEILRKAGGFDGELKAMREYLLLKGQSSGSFNTYQVAGIAQVIATDLEAGSPLSLSLNGAEITSFPHQQTLTDFGPISLRKTGTDQAYISISQDYWETLPVADSLLSNISTSFQDETGLAPTLLKKGEIYRLIVDMEVKEDAPFAMLEVPIPAGSTYQSKPQSFAVGEHREYYKDRVNFYFEQLKKGRHRFEIPLNVQFPGDYHLNPVKLSLMYSPLISANNILKQVLIR